MMIKHLSLLLREWRDREGLTDAAAARRCQMSPQLWRKLINGLTLDPPTSTLIKLQLGTGIPWIDLAGAVEAQKLAPLAVSA